MTISTIPTCLGRRFRWVNTHARDQDQSEERVDDEALVAEAQDTGELQVACRRALARYKSSSKAAANEEVLKGSYGQNDDVINAFETIDKALGLVMTRRISTLRSFTDLRKQRVSGEPGLDRRAEYAASISSRSGDVRVCRPVTSS